MTTFEYPLQWLPQQPRAKRPERARFGNHSISRAGDELVLELQRLGAKDIIISSNLKTKIDGGFYAMQGRIEDNGIVVYFKLKNNPKAMACDKWDMIEHNIWALVQSVKAIRGLERWGGSDFLDGLFTGFTALPSPEMMNNNKQYFSGYESKEEAKEKYRQLCKELHPDMGGDVEEFNYMKKEYNQKFALE